MADSSAENNAPSGAEPAPASAVSPFVKKHRSKRSFSISLQRDSNDGSPFREVSPGVSDTERLLQLIVGFKEIQGNRKTMEDAHASIVPVDAHEPSGFDALYMVADGHGGDRAALYVASNLRECIESTAEYRETAPSGGSRNWMGAIRSGMLRCEQQFLETALNVDNVTSEMHDGTTVAMALFVQTDLYVANVGDSEIVLCRGGEALKLTETHNPRQNPAEGDRVVAAGGRLFNRRVGHPQFNPAVMSIAVSRSIGDAGFKSDKYTKGKPSGLIADPYVVHVPLSEADSFLIIACDGLWDVMSPAEAVAFVAERIATVSVKDIAADITAWAFANGSLDNISVFIIALEWPSAERLTMNDSQSRIAILAASVPSASSQSSLASARGPAAGASFSSLVDGEGGGSDDGDEPAADPHALKRLAFKVAILEKELLASNEVIAERDATIAQLRAEIRSLRAHA
eukprot:c5276_g1_i1.p1 GENE.c5276_g1_i1~~c5276_g1_i1.p1  ORF type:complete len:458 (+),score=95.97 c5276_g1_i1:33-1406(+)